jgi:hypothetical protein
MIMPSASESSGWSATRMLPSVIHVNAGGNSHASATPPMVSAAKLLVIRCSIALPVSRPPAVGLP